MTITTTTVTKTEEGKPVDVVESQVVVLPDLPFLEHQYVFPTVQRKLSDLFGNNMQKGCPIRLLDNDTDGWSVKINKGTEIKMSTTLAALLGQPKVLSNSSKEVVELPIEPTNPITNRVVEDMFYVTCDQLSPNCITHFGGTVKMLDIIHLPKSWQNRLVEHSPPQIIYHPISDDILLSKLDLQLINKDGLEVLVKNPDFYVLIHIRIRHKDGSLAQGQLA
jgi:hypothetical protein